MTTTQPSTGHNATATPSTPGVAEYWQHLDCIYLEDGDMISRAATTVEQVKAALESGQPIDRAALALLLGSAEWELHQVGVHLDEVVELLGEQAMVARRKH